MKNNEVLAEEVCFLCIFLYCLSKFQCLWRYDFNFFSRIGIRLLSVMKELSSTLKILSGVG
jgi:hypothetical protein